MGLEFEAEENQICNSFAQIDYNENHMSWISHKMASVYVLSSILRYLK
jgi:hypothetical protein